MNSHPIQLHVDDDLSRRRLTVFFRLLLALPHLVWVALWGIGALVAALTNWVVTLIQGKSPDGLHRFLASYLRYVTHVYAYLSLAANPYPRPDGRPGYPVEVEIAPPVRQNRWSVAFRLVLALPALVLGGQLGSNGIDYVSGSRGGGLIQSVAVLGWFAILARGSMPRGLRDAAVYGIAYGAQLWGYLFLLTDRYPNSDPLRALGELPAREPAVDLESRDELRRSRLTVFFRALLALPHLVWLALWSILTLFALIASWVTTLFTGRPPRALRRFLARYLRYQTHVYAYLYLIANPFPGFAGARESYPVEVLLAEGGAQNRWKVAFRLPLAIPAIIVEGAYSGVLLIVAVLGWFAALVTGRMPRGLCSAGALALGYGVQLGGYLLLLTDSYPYSGPYVRAQTVPRPSPGTPPLAPAPPESG
jgi:Domain of unknown function (DUF4389)